eukprot:TRINITY_DN11962_c0_g1_i1.p1 TRINITY_DN11962_c0_g1~~TRINITY_DN11962_c0_g1_i1.p1  ORF type:complete len:236 (+),score=65.12 TRINITY_DN11962_c0_g1_i1:60-767(+)
MAKGKKVKTSGKKSGKAGGGGKAKSLKKKCPATGRIVKAGVKKTKKRARHAQLKRRGEDAEWWRKEAAAEKRAEFAAAQAAGTLNASAAAGGQDAMETDAGRPLERTAGEKFVAFMGRAASLRAAEEALEKVLYQQPDQQALAALLAHCASRGFANCARALVDAGAPLDVPLPSAAGVAPATPLVHAARGGHINVVRLLVSAGADRKGALEASQVLAKKKLFAEEYRAIQKVLKS